MIGVEGRIKNSGMCGHRILVKSDLEATGGFLIHTWWTASAGPNACGAFDDWVEDESGWEIEWQDT